MGGCSPGDRVLAVCDATDRQVRVFGRGVYVGDETPPGTWLGRANPKIQLDDGGVVWGYQCWWGEEEAGLRWVGERELVTVALPADH